MLKLKHASEFRSLTEYVTATLKDTILAHALQPGTRLVEEELAGALEVSRLPVREALKTLAATGLVDLRPHGRGAAVATPSRQMLEEVYQVRAALEVLSAELAAEKITDSQLLVLRMNVRHGLDAVKAQDWASAAKLGSEFHRLIAETTLNSHLSDLIESYDEKLRWANEPVSVDRGIAVWNEHLEIVDALAKRDLRLAGTRMKAHTQLSGRSISRHGKGGADQDAIRPGLVRCV